MKRGFGSIRSAVASSPTAAEVMLTTIANAAKPIRDERRQSALKDQGRMLAEQARLTLVGPDLEKFEEYAREFDRQFWSIASG